MDVAFVTAKLAVFVDGCFWHGCPEHQRIPKSNTGYWIPKLEANRARDLHTTELLVAEGWDVIRVWEHDAPAEAAELIADRYLTLRESKAHRT